MSTSWLETETRPALNIAPPVRDDEPPTIQNAGRVEDRVNLVLHVVAEYSGFTIFDLKSRSRKSHVAYPRQIAQYLCREVLGATFSSIARVLRVNHTGVIHNHAAVRNLITVYPKLRAEVEHLRELTKQELANAGL